MPLQSVDHVQTTLCSVLIFYALDIQADFVDPHSID